MQLRPEQHWALVEHVPPVARHAWQVPPWHWSPEQQSAPDEQLPPAALQHLPPTQLAPPQQFAAEEHEPCKKAQQTPFWQEPEHGTLHPPQFERLVCVSVHAPLQTTCNPGHAQVPPEHVAPAAHTFVQSPQWSGSVRVFVQAPPQTTEPPGHTHAPPTHEAPDAQALPHPPQWRGSVCVSTHTPPHEAFVHVQWPATHA